MPSYKFGDEENRVFELVPPGDYIVEVKSVEFGLSQGAKTRGSDSMELKLSVDDYPGATIKETLILHPSCLWKVDVAVKSLNLLIDGKPPVKGQGIDFTEHMLVGLRGWATVKEETYRKESDPPGVKSGKANKIAVWLTNKEKLKKRSIVLDTPTEEDDDVPF